MLIKTLPLGHLMANCHIVINENTLECAVIDPGEESNTILDCLEINHLRCKGILLTHGHFDHVGASIPLAEETGAPVYMNEKDVDCNLCLGIEERLIPDEFIHYDEGDVVDCAGFQFKVYATPGHTDGGVTLACEDVIFTGDTLFRGGCGRTDLDGGSDENLMASLKKLCELPGNPEVYTGHMDNSTLDRERSVNPYCRTAQGL